MFCPACGSPNDEQSRFCIRCGGPLPSGVRRSAGPAPAAATVPRRGRFPWLPVLLVGALLVVLAGVVLARFIGGLALGDSPERATREYLQAGMSMDLEKALARMCSSNQPSAEELEEGRSYWEQGRQSVISGQMQVDFSDVRFSIMRRKGATAEVRVSGTLRQSFLGTTETQEMDITYEVVREKSKWRVCDEVLEPGS